MSIAVRSWVPWSVGGFLPAGRMFDLEKDCSDAEPPFWKVNWGSSPHLDVDGRVIRIITPIWFGLMGGFSRFWGAVRVLYV